jgi:hypothetical protein
MLKIIASSALVVTLITGCATPGETTGSLSAGQWSPTRVVGQNTYLIEGYDTEDAIAGGTASCTKLGKQFEAANIVPHTQRNRATITFRCI